MPGIISNFFGKKKKNDGNASSIIGLDTMIQDFCLVNVGQGQFVILASRYRLQLVITDISGSPDRPRPLIDTIYLACTELVH